MSILCQYLFAFESYLVMSRDLVKTVEKIINKHDSIALKSAKRKAEPLLDSLDNPDIESFIFIPSAYNLVLLTTIQIIRDKTCDRAIVLRIRKGPP